ncbi:MAG: DUF3572 domain-containing protein [Hyphomicrobiales bacterium]|nr:DUF3572 domain-containing protein [Hyphomicrobiales bacterium]
MRPAQPHPKSGGKTKPSAGTLSRDDAERIAVSGLGFLAAEPERLDRFLALTGLDAAQLREAAAEPGFFLAILDHIAGHEPDLLAFSAESALAPERIAAARAILAGPQDWG